VRGGRGGGGLSSFTAPIPPECLKFDFFRAIGRGPLSGAPWQPRDRRRNFDRWSERWSKKSVDQRAARDQEDPS
jgi:hypothetical protein